MVLQIEMYSVIVKKKSIESIVGGIDRFNHSLNVMGSDQNLFRLGAMNFMEIDIICHKLGDLSLKPEEDFVVVDRFMGTENDCKWLNVDVEKGLVQFKLHRDISQIIELILNTPPFVTMKYGIHGRGHANRVLLFANILSGMLQEKNNVDIRAITIAALLHDSGRDNNGKDPLHGDSSAEITSHFIEEHDIDCDKDLIIKTIRYHCISDKFVWDKPALEAKIIGDADKLDRFRFREQESPLNIKLLELPESHILIDIASRMNGHKFRSFRS